MRGIAGVFRRDGRPVERSLLGRMATSMNYRAVGGSAIWTDGSVGLLQLGSPAAGPSPDAEAPAIEHSERFVLVFAGHIDNPQELQASLPEPRRQMHRGDSALALRAVEAWGDAAADRIVGPFAFAVWNRERRRLWCARDFLGMRPVFYHLSDRLFLFASDIHALFAEPMVSRQPNEGAVAEFMAAAPTNREETLYTDIKRVLPGRWLAVETEKADSAEHWRPPTELLSFDSDVEAAERLRDVFAVATRACLRGVPLAAAHLSGGLDSSSVVVMARQLSAPALVETASLLFPGLRGCDEGRYIDAVKAATGGPAVDLPFRPAGLEPLLRWTETFKDVPDSPNGTMHYPLLDELRARSHRVVLDGNGGDVWLTGSPYQISDCLRAFALRRLWPLVFSPPADPRRGIGRLLRYGLGPLLPSKARHRFRRLFLPMEERDRPVPPWIEPSFASRTCLRDRLRSRAVRPAPPSRALEDLVKHAFTAWQDRTYEMTERVTAFFGLDTRSPFNDRRLVDLALGFPDRLRWTGGLTKLVLRRAMGDDLPALVRERPDKGEFSAVFAEEYGSPSFAGLFRHPQLERLGWTRRGAAACQLEALTQRYRSGDKSYRGFIWGAYVLVALELWSRASVRECGSREA